MEGREKKVADYVEERGRRGNTCEKIVGNGGAEGVNGRLRWSEF